MASLEKWLERLEREEQQQVWLKKLINRMQRLVRMELAAAYEQSRSEGA